MRILFFILFFIYLTFYDIRSSIKTALLKEVYTLYNAFIKGEKDFSIEKLAPALSQAAFGIVLLIVAGALVYFGMKIHYDPQGLWVTVRELLVQLKEVLIDHASADAAGKSNVTPKQPSSFLSYMDNRVHQLFNTVFDGGNWLWLFEKSLDILEKLVTIGLKLGSFSAKHWVALTSIFAAWPVMDYFNIMHVKTRGGGGGPPLKSNNTQRWVGVPLT